MYFRIYDITVIFLRNKHYAVLEYFSIDATLSKLSIYHKQHTAYRPNQMLFVLEFWIKSPLIKIATNDAQQNRDVLYNYYLLNE